MSLNCSQITCFKQNINHLLESNGANFVVQKDGTIRSLSFLETICYTLFSSYAASLDQQMQQLYSELGSLNVCAMKELGLGDREIQKLFLSSFSKVKEKNFDRSIIKEDVYELLCKGMRATFKKKCLRVFQASDAEKYEKAAFDAFMGIALGVKPLGGSGFSDSYIMQDYKGRKLGIFKPSVGESFSSQHPSLFLRIRRYVLEKLGLLGALGSTVGGQGYVAEVAMKTLSDHIGKKDFVCDTGVTKFKIGNNKLRGSFQVFLQKPFQEAKDYLGCDKYYHHINEEKLKTLPKELIDELVVMTFLSANQDIHAENWFIVGDSDKDKELCLIDGGMCFPKQHPSTFMEKEKYNMWRQLGKKSLNRPFSNRGREMINTITRNFQKFSASFSRVYRSEKFSSKEISQRLKVIRTRVCLLQRWNLEDRTLWDLASQGVQVTASEKSSPTSKAETYSAHSEIEMVAI